MKDQALEIGKGPAITVSDAEGEGIIVPEHMLRWLKDAAFTSLYLGSIILCVEGRFTHN